MGSDRKFDETISRWFEETAPSRIPERLLGATFERTRRTRQEPAWRAVLGRLQMPRFIPAFGGAAVLVMAAVLVLTLLPGNLAPAAPASPSPAASPSSPASLSPAASPSQAAVQTPDQWGCFDLGADGGDFRTSVGTISVTATVPDGWYGERDAFSIQNAPCLFGASLSLQVNLIRTVYSDACRWRSTAIEATTPAAVTAALAAQKGHETIGSTETTVGGYPASRLDVTTPANFDLEMCDEDHLQLVEGFGHEPGTGEGATFYVIDVDGMAVGVNECCFTEDTTRAEIAEGDAIIASLQFEP